MADKPRRLVSWPTALAVVVIGGATTIAAVGSCGDDTQPPPEECTVQGMCPSDGKVCLTPNDFQLCCPVCPVDGTTCPDGCVLDFPPV